MEITFLTAGVAFIAAAIVGGGFKAFGIEISQILSQPRQIGLGVFGGALLVIGLVLVVGGEAGDREKSIVADPTSVIVTTSASPSGPATQFALPGSQGGRPVTPGGHLVANQLGGSGSEPSNLVTIFQRPANHPARSGFEFQVRSMLEAGDVVDYAATPMYRGSDLVPVGITMKAESADGLVFWTSILNRGS